MYRYLSLSRAARLVGVKRGTLQKRIRKGELSTFEGELSLDELLKAYPQTEVEDNTMIEHTRKIKANAVNRIITDTAVMPSSEILASRIDTLGAQLSHASALNDHYLTVIEHLQTKLDNHEDPDEIKQWLTNSLQQPLTEEQDTTRLIAKDTFLRLMSAHIRILPSGHDFFVEGTSSLLEAGLRAGMALDYACSNGNCGKCKARLVSGNIEKIHNHDFVLSDAEKANGDFLMCCNAAVTDVVIEAGEAHGVQDIPRQTIRTKVKKIDFPNDHIALLHVKTPRTNRLRFLAGQYVALHGEGEAGSTDVSIASCPCDDMNLHFHIPKDNSELSRHVFDNLKSGDSLDLTGPAGDFVLDEESSNSIVFIACNTGFAPIKSLIEHAMALDVAESLHLFWITADAEDRYMNNLCRSWTDALDNFYFHPVDSTLAHPELPNDESNTVIDYIFAQLGDIADYDFYVAGNNAITGSCRSSLLDKGIDPDRLKVDNLHHD